MGSRSAPRRHSRPRASMASCGTTRCRCGRSCPTRRAPTRRTGSRSSAPRAVQPIFAHVNWFQRDPDDGHFLWPGYRENLRPLLWLLRLKDGEVQGKQTPVGIVPTKEELDLEGVDISPADLDKVLSIDSARWQEEMAHREAAPGPVRRPAGRDLGGSPPRRRSARGQAVEAWRSGLTGRLASDRQGPDRVLNSPPIADKSGRGVGGGLDLLGQHVLCVAHLNCCAYPRRWRSSVGVSHSVVAMLTFRYGRTTLR